MGNIQSVIDALQDSKVNEMGYVWIADSARNAMVRILMKEAELLKEQQETISALREQVSDLNEQLLMEYDKYWE